MSLRTIPAVVQRAATRYGDREALVDGDLRWSFRELEAQVQRSAAAMIASGVQPGDRVSVWAPNGHQFVRAALGAVAAGAVLVPINTRYKGEEAAWILSKSRAVRLFVHNGFLGNDYVRMLRDATASSGRIDFGQIDSGTGDSGTGESGISLDDLAEIVVLGGDVPDGTVGVEEFLRRAATVDPQTVRERAAAITESDISDMFFTSGTTGRPKGAMTTHGQNVRVYEAYGREIGMEEGDRYLLVNPMFHTFGYKAGVICSLIGGATLIPQATFDVDASLRLIQQERVTMIPGPPTLHASILDHPDRPSMDLTSLRLAVTGASVVPAALVERMRAELYDVVIIAYGLTETCGTATVGDPKADAQTTARTVGRAIEGTEIKIVDADGTELPAERAGEVLVRGYNVMVGYFEDPAATAAAIDPGGWLHTGDIGEFTADGNLRITDRLKDMFVVGGFNVYPAEVEAVIAKHPKVSEVSVVGVPDERMGEVGRAYVIPRPGLIVDPAEIIELCRQQLANFKVPRSVRVVNELPRNASGKVLKFALREDAREN